MSHASLLVAVEVSADKLNQKAREDIECAVGDQMAPFDENGQWFADGSRWDWFVIGGRWDGIICKGNMIKVSNLDLELMRKANLAEAEKAYAEWQKADPEMRGLMYRIKEGTTLEEYLAKVQAFPPHYAFLHKLHWHERERMGWFGSARTECEIDHKEHKGKCLHKDPKTGAQIVSWGDDPNWDAKFYDRFVKPLPPYTWLVTVDYHV